MDDVALHQNLEKKESLLGIIIQCNLKWSSQVESLCSRLKRRIAGLERLRWLTSSDTRKKLVDGLFHSVLCYCLPFFGGLQQIRVRLNTSLTKQSCQVCFELSSKKQSGSNV